MSRKRRNFDALFDFNFPFRPLVVLLAECVRQTCVPVEVTLPDECLVDSKIWG